MVNVDSYQLSSQVELFPLTNDMSIINKTPFLYIISIKALVMGDFHFGQESVILGDNEIKLISNACINLRNQVDQILTNIDVELLIINGDLKHKTSGFNSQEKSEIEYFFKSDKIREKKCIIIRGNHDKLLKIIFQKKLASCCRIVNEYRIENYFFHHGHEIFDPTNASTIILSHEHPAFVMRGNSFDRVKLPAFITMKTIMAKQLIILPASSEIALGNNFPPKSMNDFLSPYLREYADITSMRIYPFDPSTGILPILSSWKK